jgi:hypothetical protein
MNIKHLMTPPHSELHDLYIERYVRSRKPHIVGLGPRQVYMKHKDGSSFLVQLQVDEFTDSGGELLFRGMLSRIIPKREHIDDDGMSLCYSIWYRRFLMIQLITCRCCRWSRFCDRHDHWLVSGGENDRARVFWQGEAMRAQAHAGASGHQNAPAQAIRKNRRATAKFTIVCALSS